MVGMRMRDDQKGWAHLEQVQLPDNVVHDRGDADFDKSGSLLPFQQVEIEIVIT